MGTLELVISTPDESSTLFYHKENAFIVNGVGQLFQIPIRIPIGTQVSEILNSQ